MAAAACRWRRGELLRGITAQLQGASSIFHITACILHLFLVALPLSRRGVQKVPPAPFAGCAVTPDGLPIAKKSSTIRCMALLSFGGGEGSCSGAFGAYHAGAKKHAAGMFFHGPFNSPIIKKETPCLRRTFLFMVEARGVPPQPLAAIRPRSLAASAAGSARFRFNSPSQNKSSTIRCMALLSFGGGEGS